MSSSCQCGNFRQDVNHVIFRCPLSKHKSQKLLLFLKHLDPNNRQDLFLFINSPSPKLCRLLVSSNQMISLSSLNLTPSQLSFLCLLLPSNVPPPAHAPYLFRISSTPAATTTPIGLLFAQHRITGRRSYN